MNPPGPAVSLPALAAAAPWPGLLGRRAEREGLDRLVAGVQAGHSQVLVLRGEAGAGKTALLDYVLERASACRIARVAGIESEQGLAFAGLHQLCAPFRNRIEHLPGPQRDALDTAFGRRDGPAPERFLAGLAVGSLLSAAAAARPLLCVVDDAQWLDRPTAQALAFVARHLVAEPVAVVIATRPAAGEAGGSEPDLAGLSGLEIGGLGGADARALLQSAVPGRLDERVRDRIIAETRGNPGALLELARADLAGGFGLPSATAVPGRIEASFRRRLAPLPAATRQLLLLAAADPGGDPVLVWRAAGHLDVAADAAAPAAAAGLLEPGGQVRFCHPLARYAAYRAASPGERQAAHHALAEATDPDSDPDRRAWHRAHAIPGLDEDAAAGLECTAPRARARGGLAAVAAFGQRAAELTPGPARRARRALAAACAQYQAGAPEAALRLLALAQAGPLDESGQARAKLLAARLAADAGQGDAAALLLTAARRLEPLHPQLAREAYRDAFAAALTAGPLAASGATVPEIARATGAGCSWPAARPARPGTTRPGTRCPPG